MTNSEAGRKAFEEVFSKWEDPNDKNQAWKGWRAASESVLAVLESPECVEECAESLWDSTPTQCDVSWNEAKMFAASEGLHPHDWKQTVYEHRKMAQSTISTIVNKLKEK